MKNKSYYIRNTETKAFLSDCMEGDEKLIPIYFLDEDGAMTFTDDDMELINRILKECRNTKIEPI